jgi:hypothetical protein
MISGQTSTHMDGIHGLTHASFELINAITWLIWFPLVTSRSSSKQI